MIHFPTPDGFDAVRLRLRLLQLSDAARLATLANDYDVARMTSLAHPFSLADAEALVRRGEDADPDREALFAIELPGEGAIGAIGFDPDGVLATEVGYWLGKPYWGRGYATEALRAGLAWVAGCWGRRCVTARHFVDNPASAAVLTRAGFLYTGRAEMRLCPSRGEAVLSRWMVWLA